MAGKAVGVLLAVAALILAAAMAVDDDDKKDPWKCFRSCTKSCHHHDAYAATTADFPTEDAEFPAASAVPGVSGECKNGCQDDECFKDLPAISYPQCVITTCLGHPPHYKKKAACMKHCCDKCFHGGPPAPGPPTPGPPAPSPPAPGPPEPSPPAPGPGPTPPSPPNA